MQNGVSVSNLKKTHRRAKNAIQPASGYGWGGVVVVVVEEEEEEEDDDDDVEEEE